MNESWYPAMFAKLLDVSDSRVSIEGAGYKIEVGNKKATFNNVFELVTYQIGNKSYVWTGTAADKTACAFVDTVFNEYRNLGQPSERRGQ